MFGLLDDVVDKVINVTSKTVSPVTEIFGVSSKQVAALLAAGYTVYEVSEMTGIAVDVINKVLEE